MADAPYLNCDGCRGTLGRAGCLTHRDSATYSDPTQAGAYTRSGGQLVMTHCIHGLDLRLYPRCYLCSPVGVREAWQRLGLPVEPGKVPAEVVHPAPFDDDGETPVRMVPPVDDDTLEGVTCDSDTPTGPCVKWTGHHDPCSGSNDLLSPFADLEDENADLRMALGAASEELVRLRGAAEAVVEATTSYVIRDAAIRRALVALRAVLRGDTDA